MSPRPRLSNRTRLVLDPLDERAVPAVLVDLSHTGAEGSANGALLYQGDDPPAGAEPADTFVRMDGGTTERGFNSDARPVQFNESGNTEYNHSLTLADVPVVEVNGVQYREFLLGITERAPFLSLSTLLGGPAAGLLSLDELRIYVGSAGNLTGYNGTAKTLAGLSPLFDLDGSGDVTVKLDDRLVASGGARDARVLIPNAAFAGQPEDGFVYLYSRFGGTWGANDGYEEWAVRPVQTPPPSAPAGSLSGHVYSDADNDGVREPDGNEYFVPEYGLEGVVLHLTGTNDLGQAVNMTVTTDANGYYEFTGLRPGTYSITRAEMDPSTGFYDGQNTVGSAGGTSNESNTDPDMNGADSIFDIVLGADVSGVGYDFGMLEAGSPG
jgi:hypothetical protein